MPFTPSFHRIAGIEARRRVFVLHGILSTNRTWRSFATRLALLRPDLELLLVDHRGHGGSKGAPGAYDLAACAADLVALASEDPPVAVIGHSFGGKVALAYAERCTSPLQVWVVDAPPGIQGNASEVLDVVAILRRLPPRPPALEPVRAALLAAGLGEAVASWMLTNLERAADGAFDWKFDLDAVAQLLVSYRDVDYWPLVRRPPPHLDIRLVQGTRSDRWTPAESAELDALPASRVVRLPAQHWVHIDAPDALLAVLSEALPR